MGLDKHARIGYNISMPSTFEPIHIIYLAILIVGIAVSALYAFTGVFAFRKKRVKALEIIVFVVDWAIVFFALTLAVFMVLRELELRFTVDEHFAISSGGEPYSVPVISEIFDITEDYLLFAPLFVAMLGFAIFSLCVQIVKWNRADRLEREQKEQELKTAQEQERDEAGLIDKLKGGDLGEMLTAQKQAAAEPIRLENSSPLRTGAVTQEQKRLEDEIVANFSVTDAEVIDIDGENECLDAIKPESITVLAPKKQRSRVLRGKTYVKSDALAVYKQYLADKKRGQGDGSAS